MTLRFVSGAVGVWDANRFNESTDEDPRFTFGQFLIEGNAGSIRLYGDGRITISRWVVRNRITNTISIRSDLQATV